MTTIKINDIEFEFDPLDAVCAEKVESVIPAAADKIVKLQTDDISKRSELIRKTCIIIFECFNELLGDGADKKVFGDSCNMRTAIEAFCELTNQVNDDATANEITRTFSKYSPAPNREQRRAAKK